MTFLNKRLRRERLNIPAIAGSVQAKDHGNG
jgi:hypothetical protein